MRYTLYLCLEGFYARQYPCPDAPLIVERDGFVLDLNPCAERLGCFRGMPLREAKAIAASSRVVLWHADVYRKLQKQWLDVCLSFANVIEPEDQHSAYLDLSSHPHPFDVADEFIQRLIERVQIRAVYGAGPSKWVAKIAAFHGRWDASVADVAGFLAPLKVEHLSPIAPEHRERLQFLGYRTVGDVAQVPLEVLRPQFGRDALLISMASRGELADEVKAVYPPGSIVDRFEFEGGAVSRDAVDAALAQLAARIGNRLASQARQGQEMFARLELEGGEVRELARRFSKPIRCSRSVLAAMRLLLEGLDAPVVSIQVRLTGLRRMKLAQTSLLGHKRAEEMGALSYVRTVFGDSSVRLASEIEPARRVRVLREWKNATGWH